MAVMSILKFGNPALKLASRDVKPHEEGLNILIKNMSDTMYNAQGVGLAAVQIGVLMRVITYDVGEGLQVMLNPEIIDSEGNAEDDEEGCLSVPEVRVQVKRFQQIEISGLDVDGSILQFKADGFLARALQHEVDHTNGIIILDKVSREERRKALRELNQMTGIT